MIDNMTRPMRRMAQKAADSVKGVRKLGSAADNASKGVRKLGDKADTSGKKIRGLGKDADYADKRLQLLSRRMRNMQTIRLAMGGALTGLGTGLVTRQVGSTLIDYEKAMNMTISRMAESLQNGVPILKGASSFKESISLVRALRDKTQQVAQITIFDPKQVAGGLFELASAGVKAKDALVMLHPVTRLAAAGNLGVAKAVDIATNITKSFGFDILKTARVVDILAVASSNANTTVGQIGQAMKFAAPSAKVAGRSIEETTSVLMSLAQRGLKDSIGGTSVARMLESIYKRSGPAVKALKSIGLAHKDFMGKDGNTIHMADMLDKLKAAAKIYGKEKVIRAIQAMMGSRGGRAAKLLYETASAEIRANELLLKLAKGHAQLMEKLMMSGVYGAYEKMRAAVVTGVIKLGEGGLSADLEYLATKVKSLADGFSELDPSTKKWIGRALLLATAISAVIIPIGIFAWALGALIPMFALLLSPIGLVVVGLALLATWLMHKYDISFDDIIWAAKELGKVLQDPIAALEKLANFSWGKIREGVRSLFPESWLLPDGYKHPENFSESATGKATQRMWNDFKGLFGGQNVTPPSGKSLARSEVDKQTALNVRTETKVDVSAPPSITLKGVDGRVHGSIPLTTSSDKGRTQVDSAAIATP